MDGGHHLHSEGWLYLAVVMDPYTRMIVGWSMGARMNRELTLNALTMAYFRRRLKPGLLRRSDRGRKSRERRLPGAAR